MKASVATAFSTKTEREGEIVRPGWLEYCIQTVFCNNLKMIYLPYS